MSHDVRDEVISGVLIVSNWKPMTWCGRAGKWRTKEVDLSWQKPAFIIPTMITVSHTSTGTSPEHKHNGAMTHTHAHLHGSLLGTHTHPNRLSFLWGRGDSGWIERDQRLPKEVELAELSQEVQPLLGLPPDAGKFGGQREGPARLWITETWRWSHKLGWFVQMWTL